MPSLSRRSCPRLLHRLARRAPRLVLLLALVLAACGDEAAPSPAPDGPPAGQIGDPPTPDQGRSIDAGLPPKADGPAKKDTGSALLSCAQIAECSDACGLSSSCSNQCATKGCASGKSLFQALTNCAAGQCAATCLFGSEQACEGCVASKCAKELSACMGHKC